MLKSLRWFAVITTVGMFLVLLMGATVTQTGSGEGCGNSWPLCHGKFIPAYTISSLIEYSHRAVTGLEGILLVVLSIWAWRAVGYKKEVKFFALLSILFTVIQAILGAMAVKWSQSDAVLALHFGISLIAFASVLLLTIIIFQVSFGKQGDHKDHGKEQVISPYFRNGIWLLTVYTYVVVYLGAYVRHTGSMLGCRGWPLCNGEWIPPLSGAAGIQFTHRVAAAILFAGVVILYFYSRRLFKKDSGFYIGSLLCLIVICLLVLSGGMVVLSHLNLFTLLLHTTLISLFFGVLSFIFLLIWQAGRSASK